MAQTDTHDDSTDAEPTPDAEADTDPDAADGDETTDDQPAQLYPDVQIRGTPDGRLTVAWGYASEDGIEQPEGSATVNLRAAMEIATVALQWYVDAWTNMMQAAQQQAVAEAQEEADEDAHRRRRSSRREGS